MQPAEVRMLELIRLADKAAAARGDRDKGGAGYEVDIINAIGRFYAERERAEGRDSGNGYFMKIVLAVLTALMAAGVIGGVKMYRDIGVLEVEVEKCQKKSP